jgi:hypothetical protein
MRQGFGEARRLLADLNEIGHGSAQSATLQDLGFATSKFTFAACRLLRLLLQDG